MTPRYPHPLAPGDLVAIVSGSAPEAAVEPEWLKRGVACLSSRGFQVTLGDHLATTRGYLSASEQELAGDIMRFVEDDRVKAIAFAGGGTNANRVLRHLDFDRIAARPKLFLGLSNPSTILNAIYARAGIVTLHGPAVIWNLGHPNGPSCYSLDHLWPMLEKAPCPFAYTATEGWRWIRPGTAEGTLIGGNLISIQCLLGTPYNPDWSGAIFFWEDIAKPTNRLDLMLTHFRDAGVFNKIAGMVVGELVNCDPPSGGQTLDEMLAEVTDGFSFPILGNVKLGHTDDKITLPIGRRARLSSEDNGFRLISPGA